MVAGPFAQTSSVAVSLRSLVDLTSGGRFSGVLTGGNGRQPDLGQTAYFQFDIPAGASSSTLLANVRLADQQTDPVIAYLVDAAGQTLATATNELVTGFPASGPSETPTSAVEVATTSPPPGRWTLILNFAPAVTGNKLAEPYHGTVALVAGPASGHLPGSASTVLAAGQPVTMPITVHNTSAAPQDYFIDARLDTIKTVQLAPQSPAKLRLPMAARRFVTLMVGAFGHQRDHLERPGRSAAHLRLGSGRRRPGPGRLECGGHRHGDLVPGARHFGCLAR